MDRHAWDDRYRGAELLWTADANRFVVEVLTPLPPGRALDLASGEGRNAAWLAERGWWVAAVDFSEVGASKASALARARAVAVAPVVADVRAFAVRSGAFDLVLVAYLHLPPPQRRAVLRAAATGVAPGGSLLVVGHDRANLDGGVGGPQDPEILLRPDEVAAELDGLVVTRAGTVERPTPHGTALDALVLATRNGSRPARHRG